MMTSQPRKREKRFADFGSNQTLVNTSLHTDRGFMAILTQSVGIVDIHPI
ncbi:hypothetical protein [Scytonema sp. NUACC26]